MVQSARSFVFPSRPNPATERLKRKRAAISSAATIPLPASAPGKPHPVASARAPLGGSSAPAGWKTSGMPRPSSGSGMTTPPSLLPLADEQLDLALLLSCLPGRQQRWLASRLEPLVAQFRSSRQRGKQPHQAPFWGLYQGRLVWLRARLLNELVEGVSIVARPVWQMSRAARNRALVGHAEALGQVMEALGCQPGADPPERELERVLARLCR